MNFTKEEVELALGQESTPTPPPGCKPGYLLCDEATDDMGMVIAASTVVIGGENPIHNFYAFAHWHKAGWKVYILKKSKDDSWTTTDETATQDPPEHATETVYIAAPSPLQAIEKAGESYTQCPHSPDRVMALDDGWKVYAVTLTARPVE